MRSPPTNREHHEICRLLDSKPFVLHSRDSFQHGLLMDQGVLCCLPGTCLLFCIFPTPDSSSLITLNPSLKMFILMLNLKLILMCLHLKHMILHLPGSTLAGLRLSYSEQGKNLLKLWKTDDMLRSKLWNDNWLVTYFKRPLVGNLPKLPHHQELLQHSLKGEEK